nr:photosystem I subunit VIII [Prochlorococcus marinus]
MVELLVFPMSSEFAATWLPAVFVPLIGLVTPAVFIVLIGRYITATD